MDETTKTNQDTSATTTGAGASDGEKGSTSEGAKTYTEKAYKEAISNALATAGRTATHLDTRQKDLDARDKAVKEAESNWQERQDERERDAVKEDPAKLDAVNLRIKARQAQLQVKADRKQLEADKASHQAEIDEARASKLEIKVFEVAGKYKVDPVKLKETGVTDPIQLDKVAKLMAGGGTSQDADSGDSSGTEGTPKSPDDRLKKGFRDLKKK